MYMMHRDCSPESARGAVLTQCMSTARIPAAKQFAFWREAVCNDFLHIDCQRNSSLPFFGEVASTQVQRLTFSRIGVRDEVSPLRYVRESSHIRRDTNEFVFLSLHLSGPCSISQDGRDANLKSGDIVCFDNSRPYSAIAAGAEQLMLHIPRDLLVERVGQTNRITARAIPRSSPMAALVGNFLREVIPVIGRVTPATACRLVEVSLSLVTTAFAEWTAQAVVNHDSARISHLYRAKALIEKNLSDPDLSPEAVAKACRISVRYLYNIFNEENTTVSEWIWQRRLEKSRRELSDPLSGDRSISNIALDCGFNNFSHFSARFKEAFSMSPSEFRREHWMQHNASSELEDNSLSIESFGHFCRRRGVANARMV